MSEDVLLLILLALQLEKGLHSRSINEKSGILSWDRSYQTHNSYVYSIVISGVLLCTKELGAQNSVPNNSPNAIFVLSTFENISRFYFQLMPCILAYINLT